jgi:hypothetical protein
VVRTRLIVASIAGLLTVGAIAALALHARIPDEWQPWAPLRLADPPNFLTRYKLSRASANDAVCRATLEQASWAYAPIADETTAPGCGYRNAVRIDRMQATVSEPFAASCREALSLAGPEGRFLREVHDGACDFFDTVLGPEYNAAHHDHLHLDRGAFRLCR